MNRLRNALSTERYIEVEELVSCLDQARECIGALDNRKASSRTIGVLNTLLDALKVVDDGMLILADSLEDEQSYDDADLADCREERGEEYTMEDR